jgi:hypothetical protein
MLIFVFYTVSHRRHDPTFFLLHREPRTCRDGSGSLPRDVKLSKGGINNFGLNKDFAMFDLLARDVST